MVAGGALAGGREVMGRVRSFQGALGLQSTEDLATGAVGIHRSAIRLGHMAGLTGDERADMEKTVYGVGAKGGTDPTELMQGLQLAQDLHPGTLKVFTENLANIDQAARASNGSVSDFIGAMGAMGRQMGLSHDEMLQLAPIMSQSINVGSVKAADLATAYTGTFGEEARNAGLHGFQGAKTSLMIAEAMGEADLREGPEGATSIIRGIQALNDGKTRKSLLREYGVNVTGAKGNDITGALRPIDTIITDLAAAGFMDPSNTLARGKDIKNVRARRGIENLATTFKKNPKLIKALRDVTPEAGTQFIDETNAEMNGGIYGTVATAASRQKQAFVEGGGMEGYAATMLKAADGLGQLEAQFPLATEALKTFTATLGGVGGGGVIGLMLGGAASGAGMAGATAAGGAAAAGLAAAGISFGAAAVAVIGAGTFGAAAAYAFASLIAKALNEDVEQMMVNWVPGGAEKRSSRGGGNIAPEDRVYAPGQGPSAKHVPVTIHPGDIDKLGRNIAKNMRPGDARRQPGGPSAR
jgi:hypothetical protein